MTASTARVGRLSHKTQIKVENQARKTWVSCSSAAPIHRGVSLRGLRRGKPRFAGGSGAGLY